MADVVPHRGTSVESSSSRSIREARTTDRLVTGLGQALWTVRLGEPTTDAIRPEASEHPDQARAGFPAVENKGERP
jgi:hypothetical protein